MQIFGRTLQMVFASTVLAGGLTGGLAGCSAESKSESFTYDYTENSCPTGKQTFSDKASYCNALLDETLNKGCAYSMRKATYEANCQASTTPAPSQSPAPVVRETPASGEKIEKIEIDALARNGLSVDTDSVSKNQSELIVTTLRGEVLAGRFPTTVRSLALSLASSVKIRRPTMAWCNLTEKNFGRAKEHSPFSIQLKGEESTFRADTRTSCLSTLTTASVDGLTVDFEDVPTVHTDGSQSLSLVTLVIRLNP